MLKAGLTITLEPYESSNDKEEYRCKVADVQEGKVFIDYPVNVKTNRTVFLLDGMQLAASFIDPASAAAVYMFRTEVIGRVKKEIPMLILHDPDLSDYIRVQRRNFVRVQTAVDIAVQFEGQPSFASVTEDISASGAAVKLPAAVTAEEGSEVRLYVVIPSNTKENHYLELNASLVRIHSDEKSGRSVASFQFENISHMEQQLLMRFCFERQLQLRKKGLE
jgi:c-di-GMP-binding flagellar brake protein YcgR